MTTDTRTPEELFDTLWQPIVSTDGELNEDRVADELFDYYHTRQRLSRLLSAVSNGTLEDPETPWFVIEQYLTQKENNE